MTKAPQGALIPHSQEDAGELDGVKPGEILRIKLTRMRNPRFFRKWWSLVKFAYDIWAETAKPQKATVMGIEVEVMPDFDRFRKDLTILCGHFDAHFNIRGETRVEARSISFANMTEEEFERLYSKTIDVVLKRILDKNWDEQRLRDHIEQVMAYS